MSKELHPSQETDPPQSNAAPHSPMPQASASTNTTSTSATSVFAVYELLEGILAELPMKDLLLAQRVSRQWKSLIVSSDKLQQLLFFRPSTDPSLTSFWMPDGEFEDPDGNSQMCRLVRDSNEVEGKYRGVQPNCLLFEGLDEALTESVSENGEDDEEYGGFCFCPGCIASSTDGTLHIPKSSWRKSASAGNMFLTQPPITKVNCIPQWRRGEAGSSISAFEMELKGGIRVRDIGRAFEKKRRKMRPQKALWDSKGRSYRLAGLNRIDRCAIAMEDAFFPTEDQMLRGVIGYEGEIDE